MTEERTKIGSALISVYHKDGIEAIARTLAVQNVKIFSTGGTYDFLKGLGLEATAVEDLTGFPSVFGGRVKTLHPAIFGGILYRRALEQDVNEAAQYNIPPIDLVIVDLYPFEDTVRGGGTEQEIIEKIDIGGISLIRAAAKNHQDVLIVASREQYDVLQALLNDQQGYTTLSDRRKFAAQAFAVSSHYDTSIFRYFNQREQLPYFRESSNHPTSLRYGENPHQKGRFWGDWNTCFDQLHGKELSYNNLVDIEAAIQLIGDLDRPAFAVIKHTNACGAAERDDILAAWKAALAGDPVSAFGGVLIENRPIDLPTAEEINKIFFEVLIAPDFEKNALNILKQKKNRVLLQLKAIDLPAGQFKRLLNGIIEQDKDLTKESAADLKTVTETAPTVTQIDDLLFANVLVKHTKSNAIVLVKDRQLIGSGIGQTSRVDSLRQALIKAKAFGFTPEGAVMASDAFFPFADCVEIAHQEGIKAVIQPGGSVRDQESVDYCNKNGLAMVMTGIRHFKH
jgi:phosphoribosylaminoimidazolecarboxamide formyltransferase/IMP cyclohydrolase